MISYAVHTRNFRQGGEGVSGSASFMLAERRKSIIADVELDALIDDCIFCTLGNSSEIMSKTVSRGRLHYAGLAIVRERFY